MFESLRNKWKSNIVLRTQLSKFSGGILSSSTMAKLDCKGQGIGKTIRQCQKVAYQIDDVINWLEKHYEKKTL